MGIEIKGLKEAERKFRKLEKTIKGLEGPRDVSFEELFTPSFMTKYTDVDDLEDLIREAGNFPPDKEWTKEDFEDISNERMDKVVRERTRFHTWDEMLSKAGVEWAARKIRRSVR